MPASKPVHVKNTFRLKMGGAEGDMLFQSLSGLSTQVANSGYTFVDAQGKPENTAQAGNVTWGTVNIQRGFDKGKALYQWFTDTWQKNDPAQRKDCTIEYLDAKGQPLATFSLIGAWPSSYSARGASARDSGAFTENVTLSIESWDRK